MQNYLAILEELKEEIETSRHRSWKWLLFWRSSKPKTKNSDPEQESLIDQHAEVEVPKVLPNIEFRRRESKTWRPEREGEFDAKIGFYRKLLHVVRVLGRDDSKSFGLDCYMSNLPILSTFCREGWNWSSTLRSLCVHSTNKTLLPTLERRVGSLVLYACLQYDYRSFQHHWMGPFHRYLHWSFNRRGRMGNLPRQSIRPSILRLARQFTLFLHHRSKRQRTFRAFHHAYIQSLLSVRLQLVY